MNKLEKAAQAYMDEIYNAACDYEDQLDDNFYAGVLEAIDGYVEKAFKAGAEWQKQQSEQDECDKMFAASLIVGDLTKPKWISVKDKLPEDLYQVPVGKRCIFANGNLELLITDGRHIDTALRAYDKDPHKYEWQSNFIVPVKYWMPIPELPKGGGE